MWPKRTTLAVSAPWRLSRWQTCVTLIIVLLSGGTAALADYSIWDFRLITDNANKKYGNLGMLTRDKIAAWDQLIQNSAELSETDKLKTVNTFFNRQFRYSEDKVNWKENDYWATPMESTIKGAADCEDYALAKYFTLRRLGIPSPKLRITYVKALDYGVAHMVLTYYSNPTAQPLVLDNLIDEIKPASQRRDLLPVYAFNAEGLFVAGSNKKGDSKKLSRWQDVLKKMRAEGFAVGEG
jgi:predicted transglutaminase-like cysteine proteinase